MLSDFITLLLTAVLQGFLEEVRETEDEVTY
jgi:hypothetical protein